jgi:DNA primase
MEFVDQLKSSIDIVKIVGEYVRLRRMGTTGRYTGLCPFHQEKTPSFSVNQTRQFYKCFGCGVSGDSIKFVMEIDGLTFWEALKQLAERNGIPMPRRSEHSDAESRQRNTLLELHAIAAEVFRANLASAQGSEARAYLERRGVSQEMIDAFALGFADASGQALVRRFSEGSFPADLLESSGLLRRRQEGAGMYDTFRGRLMFPIHNESGKVIAFGGRAMRDDDQIKYLNSPETPIYRKTSVLYNLHRAKEGMRRLNRAVLVEGYMDVIGATSAGVKDVVASCGTALTGPQVRSIHRHADTVVVNFDPDAAGANAAERALQLLLDEGLHVKVLTLDGGLDPDEYVKENGAEQYRAKLDGASGYFHWLADRARTKFDMRSSEGRVDALKFLLPAVQKISDRLERAAVAQDLASYLGVEKGIVLDQFRRTATDRRGPAPKPVLEISSNERLLVSALLASVRARVDFLPRLTDELTEGFRTRDILDALRQNAEPEADGGISAIEARLAPPSQALLHELIATDMNDEASSWAQAEACVRRLEATSKKRQVDQLRSQVKTAEREGKMEEARHWMLEVLRLEKELKAGAGG